MLRWAFLFLGIGLLAGVLGFTTIAGASFSIAKILFVVFMVIFVALLVGAVAAGRRLFGH